MTDLRTLLHDAAPEPRRELDMGAVRRRSARLGLRRLVVWFGGVGVVVAVGVPAVVGLATPPSPDAELRLVPDTTTTTQPGDSGSVGADDAIADPPEVPTEPDEQRPPSRAQLAGGPPPSSTQVGSSPAVDEFPTAPECSVDNEGMSAGEQRRCRFTATRRGGARFESSGGVQPDGAVTGEIVITRDGVTTSHQVSGARADAGELGVFAGGCETLIEPGDLVEVVLTNQRDVQTTITTLGAGEGWC